MKKQLLIIVAICISISSFAAPWDIKSLKSVPSAWDIPLHKAGKRVLPGIIYTSVYVITSNNNVLLSINLDDYTDPNGPWCKATYSVYGYYRTRVQPWFPITYSWGWGYRTWTVDVAPGDNGGMTEWGPLNSGEYFNLNGHNSYHAPYGWMQGVIDTDISLVSFVEE